MRINTLFLILVALCFNLAQEVVNYNLDLIHNITYENSNNNYGVSDVWDYTDETGIEYAIVGYMNGTSIMNVSEDEPFEVANIIGPSTGDYYFHRDYKTFENYSNNGISIPIVGEIAAGHPLLAEENNTGTLVIPEKYETKNKIFALKISGDSMIEAGIFDKDLVVIEKTINYKNNDIVAAMINNEATVKFYKKINNTPYLIPGNIKYKKVKITNQHTIIGKVVCLFRDI